MLSGKRSMRNGSPVQSACTPSMNAEQTPEPMMTGRNFMKEDGRLSEQNLLMLSGKRSMRNGQRDHQRGCPSGLVNVQAKKLETQRPLRVKKMLVRLLQLRKKRKKKKKRRRKKKR